MLGGKYDLHDNTPETTALAGARGEFSVNCKNQGTLSWVVAGLRNLLQELEGMMHDLALFSGTELCAGAFLVSDLRQRDLARGAVCCKQDC